MVQPVKVQPLNVGKSLRVDVVTVPVYTFVVVVMGCVPPMVIAGDFVVVVMGCVPPVVIAGDFVVVMMVCTLLVVVVRDFVFGGCMD